MRRTLVWAVVAIGALLVAAVAYGQATYTATATGSKKAGKPDKPKPFSGTWDYAVADVGGGRGPSPATWSWSWEGVKYNGKKFPKCTLEMIDAAQSDSVCPEGSLIGDGPFTARLGPDGDPNSNIECTSKSVRMYNGGDKLVWFTVGPAAGCGGVAYLSPFGGPITTKKAKVASAAKKKGSKKASTSTFTIEFPPNITQPLPGIAAALDDMTANFFKLTTKKKGKKISLLESTGCKGERDFTFVTVDSEGEHVNEATTGKCTK